MAARKDKTKQSTVDIKSDPSEEQIRVRAYEIYLARNGGPGDELSDWFEAEAELRQGFMIFR